MIAVENCAGRHVVADLHHVRVREYTLPRYFKFAAIPE